MSENSYPIFQIVIVTVVLTLFLYFIFQAGLDKNPAMLPDFSWLSTRNVSVFVRPEEKTALRTPEPSPCSSPDTQIRLLLAVFSAPRNTLARATIRRTWGKRMMEYPGVKMVFILGQDTVRHKSLLLEAEENNDLIIEDFHDTYLNLTLKTTFLLKWITAKCSKVKHVFKVDDDVFVNPDRLWSSLQTSPLYSLTVLNNTTDSREGEMIPRQVVYSITGHVMNTSPIR